MVHFKSTFIKRFSKIRKSMNEVHFPFTVLACLQWSFASCVVGYVSSMVGWLVAFPGHRSTHNLHIIFSFAEHSISVRAMLKNKHLQQMIKGIDSSPDPENVLHESMQIPLFTEFVDVCLGLLEPEEGMETGEQKLWGSSLRTCSNTLHPITATENAWCRFHAHCGWKGHSKGNIPHQAHHSFSLVMGSSYGTACSHPLAKSPDNQSVPG